MLNKFLACYPLVHEGPDWSSTGIILALLLASVGILITLFTILVFVRYNQTPVVKSTTRELSYIILSGWYLISFSFLSFNYVFHIQHDLSEILIFPPIFFCYSVIELKMCG